MEYQEPEKNYKETEIWKAGNCKVQRGMTKHQMVKWLKTALAKGELCLPWWEQFQRNDLAQADFNRLGEKYKAGR